MFNANNYGYNPYGRYQQPMQQPIQQETFNNVQNRSFLNGKPVDSLETAKASDFLLDGSISYYPLTDGSGIVTKQLQTDGTVALGIYEDGVLVPGSVRSVTLAAGYLGSITIDYVSKVCCKANTSITVGSVPSVINPATDAVVTTVVPTISSTTLIIQN